MVSMLSAVWISCALVVVALTICSATAVATPKSTSAGVALNMLHPSHAPTAINRRLKRTTAMEATETSEERAFPVQLPEMTSIFSRLQSVSTTIFQQLRLWKWRLQQKSSDEVFQLLKLDELAKPDKLGTEGIKLFKDPRFLKWVDFVQKRYSKEFPTAPSMEMLDTLNKYYPKKGQLTRLLVVGTMMRETDILALSLLKTQLSTWFHSEATMGEIFEALELNSLNERLFESPRFWLWLKFFKARYQEAYQQGNGAAVRLAKTAYQKPMPGYQATKHTSSTKEDAEEAFEADTLSFLRKQFKNNDKLKSVLDEGSKVDDTEVKKFVTKLLQRLNESTTEKS